MDKDAMFSEIKKIYQSRERELLENGKNLFWDTDKGIFGTSSMDSAFALFKKIELERYKQFIDLGCGDGRVVLIAALFTKVVGIEFDEKLVKIAKEVRDTLGLKCEFIAEDYMEHDISGYDIIYINPDKGFMWGLDNKLSAELTGELFVYNEIFQPKILKKEEKYWFGGPMPIIKYVCEEDEGFN